MVLRPLAGEPCCAKSLMLKTSEMTAIPVLSGPWSEQGLFLRPETAEDADFILDLFAAVRGPEFAAMGWPPALLRDFLASQSMMQNRHYANAYPGALRLIIMATDIRVGRLYLHPHPDGLRIVDIALMPDWQGRGLGGDLLRAVQAMAMDRRGGGVSLSVALANPAQRLYRRLGFTSQQTAGPDMEMHWGMQSPPGVSATGLVKPIKM
jgi:ribosomal protein S18 acetylase RimI-like enzyme